MTAASMINDVLITAINFIADAVTGSKVSFADLGEYVKTVLNSIISGFMLTYDTIVLTFTQLPAAIAEAVVNAMNAMIAAVESGLNGVVDAVNSTINSLNSVGESVGISLGTIGNVTLSRIENTYAGAGEAAGKAYGDALRRATQDHIGNALGAWRTAANERAQDRAANQTTTPELDSVDNPTRPGGSAGGGSGRRGGGGRGGSGGNDYQRQVKQLQERIAALRAETEARRGLTGSVEDQTAAVERAKLKHELLTAAQNAGMAITPQLEADIDALADSYMNASQEAQALATSQRQAQQQAQEWSNFAGSLVSGFVNDLRQGKSASEALANAVGKITDKLIDMAIQMLIVKPLMGLLGFSGGGFVGGGSIPAGPGLYASGGYTGHGGKYEPAGVVHRGEFVMSKAATSRIGVHNLEDLHQGALRGYADGGHVGPTPALTMPDFGPVNATPVQQISISAPVTVNTNGGGTPEQNRDMARQMAKQMEATMRGVVADEMRRQTRPGNFANSRSR